MDYWKRLSASKVSRRRAIRVAIGAGFSAAFLAACGREKDEPDSPAAISVGSADAPDRVPATNLLWSPLDSTGNARRGGTWRAAGISSPQTFDIYTFDPFSNGFANTVGTKLLYLQPSRMVDPTALNVAGDLAESWEISSDKLTVTLKLDKGKKFSPLSPTFHADAPESIGNRAIDAEDVLFSWERFQEISSNSADFSRAVNPEAPIESLEAPDETTVVIKLNKPYSPLLVQLANASSSYFYVTPKEGKDQDAEFFSKYLFGGGPFYIDSFEPSTRLRLKRNPNFSSADGLQRPYADEVDFRFLADGAEQLAMFRAGEIFLGPSTFTTETNLALKSELPELNLWALPDSASVTAWFGMGVDGPWKDVRIRQAVQYSWDRDLFIDVIFATDKLAAAGIADQRRWNTAIPCGGTGSYMFFPSMWLDPQSSEFGENAKYITLGGRDANLAEAKKLISAAGFPNGLDFKHVQYPISVEQQPAQNLIEGMMAEAGLRATAQEQVTIPEVFDYIFGEGDFSEMLNTVDFGGPDVGAFMRAHFHPAGNFFGGWNATNAGVSAEGDPVLNKAVEDVLFEFDNQKRVDIVHDFQRYMAKQFYYSRYPGGATALRLAWPALQNWQTFRGFGLDGFYTYEWIDETKPPFV